MRRGYNFKSFGAVAEPAVSAVTLHAWANKYKEFLNAKSIGETLLEKFYIGMGLTMATGQAKVLSEKKPMLDSHGKPMRDPSTGALLMHEVYIPAKVNATIYVWMTKNILHWSAPEKVQHEVVHTRGSEQKPEQEMVDEAERLRSIRKAALEVIDGGRKEA